MSDKVLNKLVIRNKNIKVNFSKEELQMENRELLSDCKRISKNELDMYINLGWQKGNLYLKGVKKNARKL